MYSPPTRTVGDVQNAVKRQFGDESGVQIVDADVSTWINDAQDTIIDRNHILKAKSTISSVVGQANYSLAALPIHQIEALHYNGIRLPNMAFAQAEEEIIGSPAQNGLPELWYEWAGTITLFPAPDSILAIDIYYTARPTRVDTNPLTLLSLPDKYYQDIVRYVLQQAYELDEDWQASQTKAQQFTDSIGAMGEEERSAQNMTYDVIVVYDT